MAAFLVMGPILLGLGVTVAFTWPEVKVVPMMIVLVSAGIVLPVVAYPMSYTVWQAVDVMMRPVSAADFEPVDSGPADPGLVDSGPVDSGPVDSD